jgi:OmpR family two-component system bacitracin resistance response regulator BceR
MNGWQVCFRIQAESRVPIIYLSAAGQPSGTSDQDTCDTDCIPKPFHLNVLLARVEAVLRRADRVSAPGLSARQTR